ncbi:DUF4397 domain-containing protein [Chitinophaga rhizophila]|uniref:DUF4397 domain-containing protein n=1 Tax=Chitinophaga rhizophila TaxID=2866212 RepID=A0ABS7GDK2_9BACT|nr:DUF4397 domain-containing protein [Chitinophaga rhizophila]MBW8684884.1 DUF4397 domain-containing protein [Chitinophaga rhizophila]
MTITKIRVWAMLALVIVATAFTSCLKTDNPTPQRPQAGFGVINAILTNRQMDFYDQGQKVNTNPINTSSLLVPYVVYGGVHIFAFKAVGQATDLATTTYRVDSMTYNTIIAWGDSTQTYMRAVKDDFTSAKDDKVNFRFFHLSPNIPAVDLYLDNQKVDSNRTYVGGGNFDFTFKQPKNSIYSNNIKVKLAGTDSVLVENTSPAQTFQPNRVYTIVLSGDKSFTDVRKLVVNNMYSLY